MKWYAYFLRPPGSGPISEGYRQQILAARPRMMKIAREDFGVELNATTFSGTVTNALVGSKLATELGKLGLYQDRVFKAYWQEDRDISDLEVLIAVAAEAGIDRERFVSALREKTYIEQVEADVDLAFEYGISGVPAMIINQKYLVTGARPAPVLAEIFEQVLEMERAV